MRAFLLALLVSVMVLPAPVLAAEETATIEVQLVNGTKGGVEVANQEITYRLLTNGSETDSKKVRTDGKGTFVVGGLATKSSFSYQVTVQFQEADYESEKITFGASDTRKTVKMTVYDSTTSDKAIRIETAHVIIFAEEDGLLIKEYAQFRNDDNLTYIGFKQLAPDKKETLKFFLPQGATKIDYALTLMSCCVIPVDGGVSDTMAVLPGSRETVLTYTIPYGPETYTLTEKFNYPTGSFDLLLEGSTISVGGGNLRPEAPVTIEGRQFQRFSLQSLAAGEALRIDLSGLPQGSRGKGLRWLLWGLSAVAFVAGLGFLVAKKRTRPAPVPVQSRAAGSGLVSEKRRLVAAIARLDDDFEAGKIAEDAYNRQRAARKAQLLRVMQRLKGS